MIQLLTETFNELYLYYNKLYLESNLKCKSDNRLFMEIWYKLLIRKKTISIMWGINTILIASTYHNICIINIKSLVLKVSN